MHFPPREAPAEEQILKIKLPKQGSLCDRKLTVTRDRKWSSLLHLFPVLGALQMHSEIVFAGRPDVTNRALVRGLRIVPDPVQQLIESGWFDQLLRCRWLSTFSLVVVAGDVHCVGLNVGKICLKSNTVMVWFRTLETSEYWLIE